MTLRYSLKEPLEIIGHPHNVYSNFCPIIFMVIIDGCSGEHFFSLPSRNPIWKNHFCHIKLESPVTDNPLFHNNIILLCTFFVISDFSSASINLGSLPTLSMIFNAE